MSFKIDFHVHTYHSFDSINKPKTIIRKARAKGLDAVVVLDHDSIKGGAETARMGANASALPAEDVLIIPSVEINSDIGDLIGLFVREEIKVRAYRDVIKAVKDQGGLVIMPHPYYRHDFRDDLFGLIDLIEINNARLPRAMNQQAKELAEKYQIPEVSGSDAHFPWEIGNCVTEFENVPASTAELKEMLLKGKRVHHVRLSSINNTIASQLIKYAKRPGSLWQRLRKLAGMPKHG